MLGGRFDARGSLVAALVATGCAPQVCGFGGESPRHGVVITTQDELDRMAEACVVLTGNLVVTGDEVTNLDGLEGIIGIEGSMTLQASNLQSTAGLSSLEYVRDQILVDKAEALEHVELPALRSVGGELYLSRLPGLTGLEGLDGLREVGGSVHLERLPALVGAELPPLRTVGADILIEQNPGLEHVIEPDTVFEVGGAIRIVENPRLRSVTGFDALDRVAGGVEIRHNDAQQRPTPEDPCRATGSRAGAVAVFEIMDNDALELVAGFSAIQRFGSPLASQCSYRGAVEIEDNAHLQHADILSSVGRTQTADALNDLAWIEIEDNPELVELPSLATTSPARLIVHGNDALERLSMPDATLDYLGLSTNKRLRTLSELHLRADAVRLEVVDNAALPSLDGLDLGPTPGGAIVTVRANKSLTDAMVLIRGDADIGKLYLYSNPVLPQIQAEWIDFVVAPELGSKIAGNQGWVAREVCPFVGDDECDEIPVGGIYICRPGTDTEDCSAP